MSGHNHHAATAPASCSPLMMTDVIGDAHDMEHKKIFSAVELTSPSAAFPPSSSSSAWLPPLPAGPHPSTANHFKVLVIGEQHAGKSSLLNGFIKLAGRQEDMWVDRGVQHDRGTSHLGAFAVGKVNLPNAKTPSQWTFLDTAGRVFPSMAGVTELSDQHKREEKYLDRLLGGLKQGTDLSAEHTEQPDIGWASPTQSDPANKPDIVFYIVAANKLYNVPAPPPPVDHLAAIGCSCLGSLLAPKPQPPKPVFDATQFNGQAKFFYKRCTLLAKDGIRPIVIVTHTDVATKDGVGKADLVAELKAQIHEDQIFFVGSTGAPSASLDERWETKKALENILEWARARILQCRQKSNVAIAN